MDRQKSGGADMPISRRLPLRLWPYAVLLLASVLLTQPHAADELWHDEAQMVRQYVPPFRAPEAVFHEYHPLNHVLYTVLMQRAMPSLYSWAGEAGPRWISRLALALAACLLWSAARMAGGRAVAWAAAALFLASHVTLNFATQLRGYGVAWLPVALGLWATVRYLRGPKARGAALLYALSMAVAVGIVPGSLVAAAALAAWVFMLTLAARPRGREVPAQPSARPREWTPASAPASLFGERPARSWPAAIWWIAAPLFGLAWYAGMFEDFSSAPARWVTGWSLGGLLRHWIESLWTDAWAAAPLAALGAFWLLRDRRAATYALAVFAVPLLALAAMPSAPFPRDFVPMLPLWALAFGWAVGRCLAAVGPGWKAATAVFVALVLGLAGLREADNAGYARRHPPAARPQNLYDQYYRHDFRPSEAVRGLAAQIEENHGYRHVVILDDHSDVSGFLWALQGEYPNGLPGADTRVWRVPGEEAVPEEATAGRMEWIVAHDPARAPEIARTLGHSPEAWIREEAVVDTGFFKVYAWRDQRTDEQLRALARARAEALDAEKGERAPEIRVPFGKRPEDVIRDLPPEVTRFLLVLENEDGTVRRIPAERPAPEELVDDRPRLPTRQPHTPPQSPFVGIDG